MAKKEITVTFKTITPLWTGDAWGESKEIRPSSLIGSMRFWFEVIMYFAGGLKREDYKNGKFQKDVDRKKFKKYIEEYIRECVARDKSIFYIFQLNIKALLKQEIPISSIIFGTTGWRSLIEIKDIEPIEDYCFGNKLNVPYAIGIKKVDLSIEEFQTKENWKLKIEKYPGKEFKEKLNKVKKEWSFFFLLHPYFFGKFQVKFLVEENIIDSIFLPLLTFMNDYGFWGGKWNIGYGRLKVLNIEKLPKIENKEGKVIDIDLANIIKNIVKETNKFQDLMRYEEEENKKIKYLKLNISQSNLKELIKKLIKRKAQERKAVTNTELRHKIFGKTGNPQKLPYVPQGSKILPFICEENNQLKGGFLSIVGLLNLEGERDG